MSDISRDTFGSDAPSAASAASRSGSSVPLNRTCEGCRRRKIKCILPPIGEDAELLNEKQCIRCRKLSIECVFLPPATKKSRRRNEARIRDLERKLDALQDAVEGGQPSRRSPSSTDVSTTYEPSPLPTSLNQPSSWSLTPAEDDFAGQMNALVGDPITKGFVTYDSARELYTMFHDQLAPLYPLVLPPSPSTWEDVRVRKPALFRAAIMAASSSRDPKLSEVLFQDTEKMLADKIIFKGEKSIELIQGLLILSTWYHPPRHFQGLKFSQFAHMAATMVLDLRSSNNPQYDASTWETGTEITADMLDVSRTFTACFLLCSSMALSLRRLSMLLYGPWVEMHIRVLESVSSPHLSDRRLVAWVRLQILGEDGSKALNLDNNSSESNDISDSQTQFILKSCVQRLRDWRGSIEDKVLMKPLEMHYQMIMTSFHEPAFYSEHRPEDFRPPYTLRVLRLQRKTQPQSPSLRDKAFLDCIKSAHHLLQIFLQFDIPTLRALPVIIYTRLAYAIIVLLKGHISIRENPELSSLSRNLGLEPAQLLRPVLEKLHLAAGDHKLRVPTVFYYALSNVARWCTQHFQHGFREDQEDLIEPMMHLGVVKDPNIPSQTLGFQQHRPLYQSSQGSIVTESYLTSPESMSRLNAQPNSGTSWINILPDEPTEGAFDDTFDFNFGDAYVP